jgi:indole-3-glycerol phosphate synthase
LADRQAQIQKQGILTVSESGLHTPADLSQVEQAGVEAVLIGESLVKQPDPGAAIASLFVC